MRLMINDIHGNLFYQCYTARCLSMGVWKNQNGEDAQGKGVVYTVDGEQVHAILGPVTYTTSLAQ